LINQLDISIFWARTFSVRKRTILLQEFAYRITVSWWILAGAGVIALLIAILTLCTRAIAAARANPVKSLKVE